MDTQNQKLEPRVLQLTKISYALKSEKWLPQEKISLSKVISLVFDLQKQYGKTADQLSNVVEGFSWALRGYPVKTVIDGIREYILEHADMPTPADVKKIIDPTPEPWGPDKAYYIRLQEILKASNFSGYAWSNEEKDYVNKYEEHMQIQRKNSE